MLFGANAVSLSAQGLPDGQFAARRLLLATVLLLSIARFLTAQGHDYVLGPKDVLAVTVWNQLDLSGKFTIEPDGTFMFPLIGKVPAAGRPLADVETELRTRLKEGYFVDPKLTIAVDTYVSQRIFVVGEVGTPGSHSLRGPTTLLEALTLAGSLTAEADRQVTIVRGRDGKTAGRPVLPSEAKDAEMIRIDVSTLERGDLTKNVIVRDGDTIFVSRAGVAIVTGQVRNPGQVVLRGDMTVQQVVALAGGVSDRGSLSRAKIVRLINGERQELKARQSDLVKPGDTLIVPERFF